MATLNEAMRNLFALRRTQWEYETGESISAGAGEGLSFSVDRIGVRFMNSFTGESIKVTCSGGSVSASLHAPPAFGSISTVLMKSWGTALYSTNPHWTGDRFARTPYAVALSIIGAYKGAGASGTMLCFTKTRSIQSIETLLANASKGEGFVFFVGKNISTTGLSVNGSIYPSVTASFYEQSPRLDSTRDPSRLT